MKRKNFLVFLLLVGCNHQSAIQPQYEFPYTTYTPSITNSAGEYVQILNTVNELTLYNSENLNEAVEIFEEKLKSWHIFFDTNNYFLDENQEIINNLSVINESYGSNMPIEVDEIIIEALEEAILIAELSEGYFNPTLGSVNDLWKAKFSDLPIENTDPDASALEDAMNCVVPYDKLREVIGLDTENNSVKFKSLDGCKYQVKIDLGAYIKGFIADKLSEQLQELQIPFMLNLGTSTILTFGVAGIKESWNVGIQSPYLRNMAAYAIELESSKVLSTSADDKQYFILKQPNGSVIRHHILNGKTGMSENYYRSISVVANHHAGVVDALSTILFSIATPAERQRIISRFEDAFTLNISYGIIEDNQNKGRLIFNEEYRKLLIDSSINEEIIELEEK